MGYAVRFWVWLLATASALVLVTAIVTAWAVRQALLGGAHISPRHAGVIVALAEFPSSVLKALLDVTAVFSADPVLLLVERDDAARPFWIRHFPAPEDPGYLLFSGVDRVQRRAMVKLIRIADGATLAQWQPDWHAVFAQITSKPFYPVHSPVTALAVDPLLLPDGDIIFTVFDALVRSSPCGTAPVWVLDQPMHHSVEIDNDGMLWVPSASNEGYADNAWLREHVRDDALARVGPDGRLLERRSFARIMRENGLEGLLLGTMGWHLNNDPIHLNAIQVAHFDSPYWQRGDLLISSRNLSTLFLYRPGTGKILWHQTGPWLNQHSPEFVDQHRISVLDNHVVAGANFLTPADENRVLVYDFSDASVTQPYERLLAAAHPKTATEGRARILADGGLFFEDTTNGRHLRFTADRLLWSRVNDYDRTRIGVVAWSRYLAASEVDAPLHALAERRCTVRK